MLNLLNGDQLRVTTSAAVPIHIHISHAEWDPAGNSGSGKGTPGRELNQILNVNGTTTVLTYSTASKMLNIKLWTARAPSSNGAPCDVTFKHWDGVTLVELKGKTLAAGEEMQFTDSGFLDL